MSDFRPSRYIMHSGYATVKTYDTLSASLSLPATVSVGDDDVSYEATITLPTNKGVGWRSIVIGTDGQMAVSTPNFLIPCKATSLGTTFDTFINGEIVRVSSSQITMKIVFAGYQYGGATYSDYKRNYTFKLQVYVSPFEA